MPAAMTNYLENKLVDHTLSITQFAFPGDVWIALFDTGPTDAETTGVGNELLFANGGYLRLKIDQAGGAGLNFSTSSGGNSDNDENWDFEHDSSGNSWDVTGVGIFDSATVGACLLYELFSTSIPVAKGNTLRFAAGIVCS